VNIQDFFLNRNTESAPHTRTYEIWYNSNIAFDALKQNTKSKILRPLSATHSVIGDVTSIVSFPDDHYVMMKTGDVLTLIFPFIPLQDEVRDFIFVGEGYYVPLNAPAKP